MAGAAVSARLIPLARVAFVPSPWLEGTGRDATAGGDGRTVFVRASCYAALAAAPIGSPAWERGVAWLIAFVVSHGAPPCSR